MERRSVRQVDKGDARLRVSSCAYPALYLDRHVFRRFADQNTAHVEVSSVHAQRLSQSFVKSQLSEANAAGNLSVLPASLLYGFPVVESSFDCLKISGV